MAAKKKAAARKSAGSRTSHATLSQALKRLGPPTTPRVLLPAVQKVGTKVDALLRRRTKTAEINKAWGKLGTLAPPPMHVMGGHLAFWDEFVGLRDLFDGMYVPGNDTSWWIQPDHHYIHDQGWSGYADKMTGSLGVQASAHDPTHPLTTSTGGVYSQVFTTPSKYGQVSLGTFDVDLTWEASGRFLLDFPYANSVYGRLRLIGRIWLAVYEFNVATSKFEQVVAVPRIVFNEWFDTAGEYHLPVRRVHRAWPVHGEVHSQPGAHVLDGRDRAGRGQPAPQLPRAPQARASSAAGPVCLLREADRQGPGHVHQSQGARLGTSLARRDFVAAPQPPTPGQVLGLAYPTRTAAPRPG